MKDNKAGPAFNVVEVLGSSLTDKFDGTCQHEGCDKEGFIYEYPLMDIEGKPETIILCSSHTKAEGFCFCCGGFYGGVESFDFSRSSICDGCKSEYDDEDYHSYPDDPMVDYDDKDY